MHPWLRAACDPAWLHDTSGYAAASLVLSTFSVTSMRVLRLLGIGSNVRFVGCTMKRRINRFLGGSLGFAIECAFHDLLLKPSNSNVVVLMTCVIPRQCSG
jgi:hypothetical protein